MKKKNFERGALKIMEIGVQYRIQHEKIVRHVNFQRCITIVRHCGLQHQAP